MGNRLELQKLLEALQGNRNVYFQPPNNVLMVYPCIVYGVSKHRTAFAGNHPYRHDTQYTVTVMDRDPESPVIDKLKELPKCLHDRHFEQDNLNHDVFNLYF
jgi:hypothetical protein